MLIAVNFYLCHGQDVNKNLYTEMSAILFLIVIGIVVAGGFLMLFIWAVRTGQYDDSYSPSVRMLFENPEAKPEVKEEEKPLNQNNKQI